MPNLIKCVALIAIAASAACRYQPTAPAPAPTDVAPSAPVADPNTTVTVEFGGQVVNADAGGPVANVRVSLDSVGLSNRPGPDGWVFPRDTATSGEDGTFTLPLDLPSFWASVYLKLTGPPGYDDRQQWFLPKTAADRPAIRMYPTLVIRPGESIEVRVDSGIVWRGWDEVRRVLVAASPGAPVELELVPDDSSKPMALGSGEIPWFGPDMSVRRLMVTPGAVPYVLGAGTARLTARR